jgi:hypothetical protein
MGFQQQAARFRFKRSMMDAGRTDRVGVAFEFFSAIAIFVIADDQITGNQEHLFPVVMDEGRLGVDAGGKTQKSGTIAAVGFFIERPSNDFFLDARRITRQRVPALVPCRGREIPCVPCGNPSSSPYPLSGKLCTR